MLDRRLSTLAQADLEGIWNDTVAQWDEAQAQA